MTSAFRRRSTRLLVLGAALAGTCGAAELGLRAAIPPSDVSLFRYIPSAPFRMMKPNVRGTVYGVPIETNNMGFRDAEDWTAEKPAGERRIAVVGDSFTVGAGVPFAEIYSERIEQRLQAMGPPGRRVRVMNLAVGGHDIVRYAMVLAGTGQALDPDGILVGIFPYNDFEAADRVRDERIARGLQPPPARERFDAWRLYQLWRTAGWSLKSALAGRSGAAPDPVGWEENLSALATIAALGRRDGVPVAAVLLPAVTSGFSGQRAAHARVQAACGRIGMTCVEMLDAFLASGVPAHRFRLNLLDGHPNARYHEVVAARLAAALAGWAADGV